MSEAVEQIAIHKSPLEELQRQHGAVFVERDGWRIAASYGDTRGEYETVRDDRGAGLFDLSSRGRIRVSGTEAVAFLNGLITNDVKNLEEGAWMAAAFPNAQGRFIAHARVLRQNESYIFDTDAVTHERMFKTLERFTLAGDFRVEDLTEKTALISVQGAGASAMVSRTLGEAAARVERGRIVSADWNDQSLAVIRSTRTGEDGFDLLVSAERASALWEMLASAGARPVGADALEILRIEAGLPRYGADMDETNVVLEAGLDDAVSFTKGCYIGQEIIARVHWRGHVAKRLAGINLDGAGEIERGDKIKSLDGKEIGRITSATRSPHLEKTIALAYVKYDYLAPGTKVFVVMREDERAAHVTMLPFVRGSWFRPAGETESGA